MSDLGELPNPPAMTDKQKIAWLTAERLRVETLATGANIHTVRHTMGSLSYAKLFIEKKPERSQYYYEYALLRLREMRRELGGMLMLDAQSWSRIELRKLKRRHEIEGEGIHGAS